MDKAARFDYNGVRHIRQLMQLTPVSIANETDFCRRADAADAVCLLADQILGPVTPKWHVADIKSYAKLEG